MEKQDMLQLVTRNIKVNYALTAHLEWESQVCYDCSSGIEKQDML
jgi:hypothetical protein